MKPFQQEFLNFALEREVLKFGSFTLKSGRNSPYFFNAGNFNTGKDLARLGVAYADAIMESGIEFDVLFGPAYKGIPLAATTSVALHLKYQKDVPWCFDRKEIKDHGEGGKIVGSKMEGRILIIDDVITAGTAIREAMDLIHHESAEAAGVVIALDRQERGQGERSAIQEVEEDFDIPVISIIKLENIYQYLVQQESNSEFIDRIQQYRNDFGI